MPRWIPLLATLSWGAASPALGQSLADSTAPAPSAAPGARPAATPPDSTSRRFYVEAGTARMFLENGERVSILSGGVHLTSDSTTVDSDWARVYRERELAFFFDHVVVHEGDLVMTGNEGEFDRRADIAALAGDVVIVDPKGTILADRVRYWRADRILRLWGHVDFQDPETRVQADSVVYREDTGIGDAYGNVVITDVESGSEARGPQGVYDRITGVAHLVSRPRMVLRQEGVEDTWIEGEDLQTDREEKVLRIRGDVHIRRGDMTAEADSAILYREQDKVLLRGRPRVEQGSMRMHGREIDVYYADSKLRRVDVRNGAYLAQMRSDTLLIPDANEVLGDSARLFFDAGELQRAVVVGHASSKYVPRESRPNRISLNEAQADSIVMLFHEDDIEEVIFTGAASGVYRYYEGDLEALRHPAPAVFDTVFGVVRGDTTEFDFRRNAEPVQYSAERILYLAAQNALLLQNAAEVIYQGRTLNAGKIRYDANTDILDATERPMLDDAGTRMYGDDMGYDMETEHAWVRDASTTFDQGYYSGRELRKDEKGVLQVSHGSYTTCDLLHPHYRFESDQMKIYMHDKVVGRPVRVYLGDVPVGYLPFIVNSVNTDRHSGFLQPYFEFGLVSDQRYIRGLDYYWAASPYFDFLFSSDFTDRQRPSRSSVGAFLASAVDTRSYGFGVNMRYKLRYNFDGNVDYRFHRDIGADSFYWTLGGSHDQKLGERATLRGNLDYASSDRAVRQVNQFTNYERSLNRQLTSGLTLNRPGDLISFSANLRRVQVVNPGDTFTGTLVTNTLPSMNVTFRPIRLGPAPKDPDHPGWTGWLHDLQLRPAINFARETSAVRTARDTLTIPPEGVSTADSFVVGHVERISASTGAGLSRRFNVWFLDMTPSVNYSESYVYDSRTSNAKRSSRHVGTGLQTSTTFYGTFHPNRWGIAAIRHRLEPRATLSYTPEIAGQQRRATSVSLSLGNIVDAKVVNADGEERRIDSVFNWSLSTSYNPTTLGAVGQPDRKFSNIASNITINQSGPLRLTIGQTYDPYAGKILETRVPFGMRLSGRFGYGDTGAQEAERNRVVQEEGEPEPAPIDSTAIPGRLPQEPDPLADIQPVKVGAGDGSLSWDLGLSYSLVRIGGETQNARVGVSFGVQPTKNWHVQYTSSYDGRLRTFANPSFRITRDLHCWKASFARIRDINEWRYYFRIFVVSHEQDLFIENGDRSLGY